ncbi:MAG TPA: histidine triad nucleotide-binding protein [Verrucomicrobiae bacterium]|nr:histidine triad nucleotide-binding protein [Verrucomicrobiae bacterium]
MENCLFCSIVDKKIPANIVYEDELVIAFHDIHPVAPVHVLIVPKKHISSLNEAEEQDKELLGHILLTAGRIAKDLGIAADGYRLINNCGQNGGQVIYHIHFHLLGGKNLGSKIA